MAFSTIFIIVIIGYVFVYAGMICYDLFIKKDPMELAPKVEDEDIDISDEVGQFQPILIDKDAKENGGKKETQKAEKVKSDTDKAEKKSDKAAQDMQQGASAVTFDDDEPGNRKSLNDNEPKAADKATEEHIRELVKEVRQQMDKEEEQKENDAEKQAKSKTDSQSKPQAEQSQVNVCGSKPTEQPPPFKESIRHAPYRSPDTKPVSSSKARQSPTRPSPVRPWQEKPKKPTGPMSIFERTVRIAKENQETKLCDGITAESFSDKLKSYTTAELREMLKRNSEHWVMKDSARQPDEDDLEILRINASMKREKSPTFMRSNTQ